MANGIECEKVNFRGYFRLERHMLAHMNLLNNIPFYFYFYFFSRAAEFLSRARGHQCRTGIDFLTVVRLIKIILKLIHR